METQVRDTLGTLLQAQDGVRSELRRLAGVQPLDRGALGRLREVVHGLADQADRLILTLVGQDAPDLLVTAVEEVFDAFRDAEGQIEGVIKRGRR